MGGTERYSIGELARRAEVSRRTVRYYVQRGLLPSPLGRGRGRHYDRRHLEILLRIKALQAQGEKLETIGALLRPAAARPTPPRDQPPPRRPRRRKATPAVRRWARQVVLPGYELHIADTYPPLDEGELTALATVLADLVEE